jgi:hypothetical protein
MSTINLLPDDYHKRREELRISAIGSVLFVVVMVGVMLGSMESQSDYEQLETRREQVSRRYEQANQLIQKMHALEQKRQAMAAKADDTAKLMERMPRSYLLAMVTQRCPKNISLRQFELVTKPMTPQTMTKFEKIQAQRNVQDLRYSQEIFLTGYAKSDTDLPVAHFLQALENSPAVAQADLESSKDIRGQDGAVREFKFHLYLTPNLDVIDLIGPDRPGRALSLARPADRDL